jgi:hypothetical protein
MNIVFSGHIFEKCLHFIKILLVGPEFFHADGRTDGRTDTRTERQTDMTKLTVAFRNFANATKMTDGASTFSVVCCMLFYDIMSQIT